jgi:CBS domain-containing protein
MLIRHIIKDKGGAVHAIADADTLGEAARALHDKRVGCMVVLDADGALAGILSERDIVRQVAQRGANALSDTVASAMTRNVVVVHPDLAIDDALERMTDRRIRHLPVLEDERLIGIVSIGDLVKWKIDEVQVEAAAMRAYIATG